ITEEQLALQASIREWAKRARPLAQVRRLEPGSPPAGGHGGPPGRPSGPAGAQDDGGCWNGLADLGIFSIGLPVDAGGAGGTVADLAAALEQITCALVPGPVMPTLLAGQAAVAVGLTTGTMTGAWAGDGTLRVNGQAGPVLGGGSTAQLLLGAVTDEGEAWFVLAADHPGVTVQARRPADFSRSLADIQLTEAVIPPGQVLTGLQTARVRDLAATLYAAEAAAVAGSCCGTAAQYARTRHQFGRPIGSFQAIKHLCAGMLCRAESATVLAWDAARAADEAPDEHRSEESR